MHGYIRAWQPFSYPAGNQIIRGSRITGVHDEYNQ